MFNLQNIRTLIENGKITEAAEALDSYLETDAGATDAEALFMRGKLDWQLGNKRAAMGYYKRAAAIDPASPATTALNQAYEIMAFFNPDIYNP